MPGLLATAILSLTLFYTTTKCSIKKLWKHCFLIQKGCNAQINISVLQSLKNDKRNSHLNWQKLDVVMLELRKGHLRVLQNMEFGPYVQLFFFLCICYYFCKTSIDNISVFHLQMLILTLIFIYRVCERHVCTTLKLVLEPPLKL